MKNKIAYLNDSFSNSINGTGIDKFEGYKKYLSTESIQNNKIEKIEEEVTIDDRPSRANVQPKYGDVLFARMQNTEKVMVVDENIENEYIFSSGFMSIKPKENILDSNYLSFFFKSKYFNTQKDRLCNGGTQKALNNKSAEKIKFPLPQIDQQKQIAKTLDKAQELIDLRKESIAKLDELAKSIFIDMFGDPVSNPNNWKESELSKVVDKNTIVTYGIVQAGEEFQGGVPYIRTGDIVHGKIKLDGLRYTDPLIAEKYERSKVLEGEIVMSIRATVGTIAFVPKELDGANLTQGTARISPGKKVNSKYLFHFIKSEGTQFWISRQVKGATFKEITLKRLREMPILLPPIELQNKFASIIEKIEEQKSLYEMELAKLEENFQALLQQSFQE